MSEPITIDFVALSDLRLDAAPGAEGHAEAHALVVFAGLGAGLARATAALLGSTGEELVARAAKVGKFKGQAGNVLDLVAPAGLPVDRLLVVGVGVGVGADPDRAVDGGNPVDARASDAKTLDAKTHDTKPFDATNLGGIVAGRLGRGTVATIVFDLPRRLDDPARAAAEFALGLRLRDYRFDQYKTGKKKDEAEDADGSRVVLAVAALEPTRAAAAAGRAIADGVMTARSLVNEPANVLFPAAFADRVKALESLGVEVNVLDVPAMQALGMGAILGVTQGSSHPGRIVTMRWNGLGASGGGADASESRPLAFIGKGVTFDTGGISIKPAGGMEDMKGDMAGAACVVGLMQALAGRKAKVDVVGAIGIVENMPGPDAQRPGDIVTSLSGQTIEIINTDAEGRLVLADVLWYVQDQYKPRFMIDVATLTGAILIALGQEHAGLFSNDDELSERLAVAGRATGEKVWRMPLTPAYDKLIDSKFADMKNTGGRHAGSITAAQFIQRFVNDVPWAHLDIAGMGMSSPANDINQSWGSGWGVRLLDRLVRDYYEAH